MACSIVASAVAVRSAPAARQRFGVPAVGLLGARIGRRAEILLRAESFSHEGTFRTPGVAEVPRQRIFCPATPWRGQVHAASVRAAPVRRAKRYVRLSRA